MLKKLIKLIFVFIGVTSYYSWNAIKTFLHGLIEGGNSERVGIEDSLSTLLVLYIGLYLSGLFGLAVCGATDNGLVGLAGGSILLITYLRFVYLNYFRYIKRKAGNYYDMMTAVQYWGEHNYKCVSVAEGKFMVPGWYLAVTRIVEVVLVAPIVLAAINIH